MESRFIDLQCKMKVEEHLEFFKSNTNYVVMNNIVLHYNGQKLTLDHVVVSIFGIFVIERNKGKGTIYGDEFSLTWKQRVNFRKFPIDNSIRKNKTHVIALQELINTHYPKVELDITQFVVFTDEEVKLKIDDPSVIKIGELKTNITKYTNEVLTKQDIWNIQDLLMD